MRPAAELDSAGSSQLDASTEVATGPVIPRIPGHVARHLLKGSFALGFSVSVERGMGFLANILAARLGGAHTFGAYSLAISTANNISTYAGGGIGSTAARFSGKYPRGGPGYSSLAHALGVVSIASAAIAAAGLWLGAAPIAHLLQKPELTGLLRWTGVSAVGIILVECARGFFIGQSRLPALMLLSLIVGSGMVLLLPFAALSHSPVRMIVLQGAITISAVSVCLLLARRLGLLTPESSSAALPLGPMLREVWGFGMVQLGGLIGVNFAGWWLTTLVARSDTTLVQMSFFAIASQLRNIAGLAPSMLTESSYAVMGEREGNLSNTPQQVMALCTFASTAGAFILSGIGIVAAPLALKLMYGGGYARAAAAVVAALAVAVVHMGNAPAAARLSIVSIRATGIINTAWAIFVALTATLFLLHNGSASKAMSIYFAAHVFSSGLVLLMLRRKDHIPPGMVSIYCLAGATGAGMTALAWWRIARPAQVLPITALMSAVFVIVTWLLLAAGRKHGWVPSGATLKHLALSRLSWARKLVIRSGGDNEK